MPYLLFSLELEGLILLLNVMDLQLIFYAK